MTSTINSIIQYTLNDKTQHTKTHVVGLHSHARTTFTYPAPCASHLHTADRAGRATSCDNNPNYCIYYYNLLTITNIFI